MREVQGKLRDAVRPLSSAPDWPEAFGPLRDHAGLRVTIGPQWPELGLYDEDTHHPDVTEATEPVGDAIDDLADLVDDLRGAPLVDVTDAPAAASWLSFHARAHWDDHVDHVIRHLDVLLADQP